MNKADLIEAVAASHEITKTKAGEIIDTIFGSIEKTLASGDEVTLVGFGTFGVAKRAARTGRNPKTGATIKIDAKKVPKFRPGKGLRDALK